MPKVDLTRVQNAAQRRLVDKFTDERKKAHTIAIRGYKLSVPISYFQL